MSKKLVDDWRFYAVVAAAFAGFGLKEKHDDKTRYAETRDSRFVKIESVQPVSEIVRTSRYHTKQDELYSVRTEAGGIFIIRNNPEMAQDMKPGEVYYFRFHKDKEGDLTLDSKETLEEYNIVEAKFQSGRGNTYSSPSKEQIEAELKADPHFKSTFKFVTEKGKEAVAPQTEEKAQADKSTSFVERYANRAVAVNQRQ